MPAQPSVGKPLITEVKRENNSLLYFFVFFLVLAIGAAVGLLVYIQSQPSSAQGFAVAKDALVEVRSADVTLNVNYDLKIIPTEFQQSQGTNTVSSSLRLSGKTLVDTIKQQSQFTGTYKSIAETLDINYVYDAGTNYTKYGDKDYVVSADQKFELFTPHDFSLHDMLLGEDGTAKYGYGSVDSVTSEPAFRYKYYPTTAKINNYVAEFVGKMIRNLYSVNPPTITVDNVSVTDFEWRVWSATKDYHPTQIQIKIGKIIMDLGALGTAEITNYTAELDLNSLNEGVSIEVPK